MSHLRPTGRSKRGLSLSYLSSFRGPPQIASGFDADPEQFQPIFWKQPTCVVIVMDWAAGFLEAVEMRRAASEPLFSHRKAKLLIEPLVVLGDDGEHDDERDPDDR
jgi:hypothetical protein